MFIKKDVFFVLVWFSRALRDDAGLKDLDARFFFPPFYD